MSVDDWARREAERYAHGDVYGDVQLAFRAGVASLADALLSDEAVEAAAKSLHDGYAPLSGSFQPNKGWEKQARAALQAAVDAVTKEARND